METDNTKMLEKIPTKDLAYELEKRKALELKREYEKRREIILFIGANEEVFKKLLELMGTNINKQDFKFSLSYTDRVIFSICEDIKFCEQCMDNKDGNYVWEKYEKSEEKQ